MSTIGQSSKVSWLAAIHDVAHPVSAIAAKIEPYLRVLVEDFHPEHMVLFGSYAYGQPNQHSDIDILIVKPLTQSAVRETIAIHRRWREVVGKQVIPIDVLIESPESHRRRMRDHGAFYHEINERGLQLV